MQRGLPALLPVVLALCGALLVTVPRFFLPPPVPVGLVAHSRYRLPPHTLGEAKADTGQGKHKEAVLESGGQGRRCVSLACLHEGHHDSSSARIVDCSGIVTEESRREGRRCGSSASQGACGVFRAHTGCFPDGGHQPVRAHW